MTLSVTLSAIYVIILKNKDDIYLHREVILKANNP